MGLSSSFENFARPLAAHELTTFEVISPDELWRSNEQSLDEVLIARCRASRPTLVFWVFMGRLLHFYCHPSPTALFTIRTELNIPIALFLPDAQDPQQIILGELFAPYLDFIVHALSAQPDEQSTDKYIRIPHPKDPAVFNDPQLSREIDVCFAGSCYDRPLRIELIRFLENEGIKVHKVGGQREQPVSSAEFALTLKRSKIALNIMDYGRPAINGRLMEATLCGSLLFNAGDSEAELWLTPEREFVQARTKAEVVSKIRYLLAHDQERTEIARRGHEKALQLFDGRYFWQTLIDRASQPTPFKPEQALVARGCYLDNLGDIAGAEYAFKAALEIDPDFLPAIVSYALHLRRDNRDEQAQKLLLKGIELPNSQSDIFLCLTRLYHNQRQSDQVAMVARAALSKFSDLSKSETVIDLAKILLLCKDFSAVQGLLVQTSRQVGKLPWQSFVAWSAMHYSLGQLDQATAIMSKLSDVEVAPVHVHQEIEDVAGLLNSSSFVVWAKDQFKPDRLIGFPGLVFLGFVADQKGKRTEALLMFKAIQQLPDYQTIPQVDLVETRVLALQKGIVHG